MDRKTPKPRAAPPLPVAKQAACIGAYFPQFRRRNPGQPTIGIWEGSLQPSAESPKYVVRISYTVGEVPCVEVISPKIRDAAPHRFAGGALCLYFPDDCDWTSQKFIALTIIPWTASWLYFYEHWLKTGRWLGPEAPHGSRKVATQKHCNKALQGRGRHCFHLR